MPNYSVSRSISIKATKEHLFNSLVNLNEWKEWSPWLIQEPEAEVTTSEDHKTHEWKGKRLGHGKLTVVNELPSSKIDYILQYFKPWKSVSDTSFILEEDGVQTKVTWTMDGKLPFYMFWMKGMMKVFLGMDYERGLNMLKEYIELGKPNTQLNFNGESEFQGFNYVGIKRTCAMEELKDSMPKDIASLVEYLEAKDAISGSCFSIYHKWQMVKGRVTYTTGFPVSKSLNDLPDGFLKGEIPTTNVYEIEHVGDYKYLGNAWVAINAMSRNKEIKASRKLYPFEVYVNNPNENEPKDLITKVYQPIK